MDARRHRLRALGLHLQQAQHRPRGRAPAVRDRLGLRPAVPRAARPRSAARIRASLERHAALVYAHFTPSAEAAALRVHAEPQLHPDRGARGRGARADRRVARGRSAGRPPPTRTTTARTSCSRPTATTTRASSTGSSPPRGWCTSSTRGSTRPARACGSSARTATGSTTSRTCCCRTARTSSTSATSGRARSPASGRGEEIARLYPGGTLQSNFNLLYRVAARLRDPETQAVADRCRAFGHTNLEEYWTLLWRDAAARGRAHGAPAAAAPLRGLGRRLLPDVVGEGRARVRVQGRPARGPPRGAAARRASRSGGRAPATRTPTPAASSSGRAGRLLVGDTGYAGRPQARHHNTVVVGRLRPGPRAGARHVGGHGPHGARRRSASRSAALTPSSARIVAEIAAAYPHGGRAADASAASSPSRRRGASACATGSRPPRTGRSSGSCTRIARSRSTGRPSAASPQAVALHGRVALPAGRAPAHGPHDPHGARPARVDRAGPPGPARLRARGRASGRRDARPSSTSRSRSKPR